MQVLRVKIPVSGNLPNGMPRCPKCGNNRQVWKNQISGKLQCHRAFCDTEIPEMENEMKDVELPPLPVPTAFLLCKGSEVTARAWSVDEMQAYARAAVEADRAQRVPDGYSEDQIAQAAMEAEIPDSKLESLLIALASTPAQPAQQQPAQQQPPQRKLSAVDLAKAAAKEQFRHYREVMVNAHQEPPQPVERKPMTYEALEEISPADLGHSHWFKLGFRHAERHHGIGE